MKNNITYAILLLILPTLMMAQGYTDTKSMTFKVSDLEMVRVHNFKGNVEIKGTNSSQGKVTIKRKFKTASKSKLTKAKELIFMDTMYLDNQLYFYVQTPDKVFKINADGEAYYNSKNNGSWLSNNNDRFDVDAEFTVTMELPKSTKLSASVHHKDLSIEGVENVVSADTHHGSVTLSGLRHDVEARSHHGDVTVQFDKNPTSKLICHTHHGDIKIAVQSGLSADVSMKSHHGSFYTDFDYQRLAMKVNKDKDDSRGTKYKIGGNTNVRIGNGDVVADFRTHHGDVFITK